MKKLLAVLVLLTFLVPASALALTGQKIFMPYTASGDGWWTGVAITNVTNATQSVTISARTDAGVYVAGKTVSVPAYGMYVDLLENFFTNPLATSRVSLTFSAALAGTNTFYATLFVGNPDGGFGFQNYTSVPYEWEIILPPIDIFPPI